LLIAATAAGLPVYVRPQIDPLRHADAILILGGADHRRYPYGFSLGEQGWAPNVAVSNPSGTRDRGLTRIALPHARFPGIDIELSRVLHASEAVFVPGPIPPSGTGRAVTRFTDIWDKGKAAVIWSDTTVTTPDGTPLWTQKRSIFARGEGGFGGERGPSTSVEPPDRAPDFELALPTLPQQALLYRMCGDRNPLHSDPEFASAAGFPKPILHGLCTYGIGCKALVDAVLDGDVAARHRMEGRRALHRHVSVPARDGAVALGDVEFVPV
jgi:hypothetical protein